MIKNLEILHTQYKFDYIYINPKNIKDLNFEFKPEEMFADFASPAYYLGSIILNNTDINVYWDKKITPDDVIFKYKDIKKERSIKLSTLFTS